MQNSSGTEWFHCKVIDREKQSVWYGLILTPGLPRSGKSKEKTKIFQGRGKVREFFEKSGKIFDIVKVSELSGNSVSGLWIISFLQDLKKCIFFRER